ncbi:hypothetical protein MPNT_10142 [Candidatus Methylacidithermus pantelleriae]|uniref:Uncharacterized protein n=1 Tax=Candidatus Methylacidithermus pantelleriae TaxID=2744239 RepID=A0A8J2BLK4_9BACT|nr:hypothetical protein MPNT_10142 [Candidatus Methylacidithermus pantelleriae]
MDGVLLAFSTGLAYLPEALTFVVASPGLVEKCVGSMCEKIVHSSFS